MLLAGAQAPRSSPRRMHDPRVTSFVEQGAEENRTQPIVMRFTGREREMDRQAIGVDQRVNLAREASSRATHSLVIVVRDTRSVLVHAHDGGIDHLHCRIMTGGQRIHDPVQTPARRHRTKRL